MNIKTQDKIFVFLVMFFIFSFVHAKFAYADLEITEVMYDVDGTDADREWVEIYNNGDSPVDVSSWSIADYDTSWHYHGITPYIDSNLGSNSYAVLVRTSQSDFKDFKLKYPNYTGSLFRGSFDLGNDNGKIALSTDKKSTTSEVSYDASQGANGDGNSLQKIDGVWKSALPTMGIVNKSVSGDTTNTNSTNTNPVFSSGSSSASQVNKKESEVPKITTEIIAKSTVINNIEFPIENITLGYSKEHLTHGRFVWNFGDGVTKEEIDSKPFTYSYQYPGDYVLSLSYYYNYYSMKPDATDRMTIKVLPAEVYISSVGNDKDAFVELENKSNSEVDMSCWILKGINHSFTIPEGMVILPNKKLKLSPRVTLFDSEDLKSIMLQNPKGETFSTYPVVTPAKPKYISAKTSYSSATKSDNSYKDSSLIDLNTLGASSANSNTKISNTMMSYLGLGGVIIVGLFAVLHIGRKKTAPEEDIEKEVRAEDITIME